MMATPTPNDDKAALAARRRKLNIALASRSARSS